MPNYEVDWVGDNNDGEEDAGCITVNNTSDVEAAIANAKVEIQAYDVPDENIRITDVRSV